ncbi:uncharacterized protein KZ484_010774 [Pholidichthys leucotaenia]
MKFNLMENPKCSGRWWRTKCISAVKTLASDRALKPLVPTIWLVIVVIYGLGDKLRNFVAAIFIPQYHYQYPVALCFGQVSVSLLFLNLLHVLDLVPLKPYFRPLGERLLVPSICGSIQSVLAMWAKTSSLRTNFFLQILPLLPTVTVGFSFLLKLSSIPSRHFAFLISIIGGTSVVVSAASYGLSDIEPLEYMYALLALILHGFFLVWLAKVSEAECHHPPEAQASACDIYYTQLVNQSWVLGILWLVHPESPWEVLRQGNWQSLLFYGYMFAILLLDMVLNFVVGILALCVSPFAAALLHSARQLAQSFLSLGL